MEIYLELEGIEGRERAPDGAAMMEAVSFNFSVYGRPDAVKPSAPPNESSPDHFTVTRRVDALSPRLNLACLGGERIAWAAVHVYDFDNQGGEPLFVKKLSYRLEDCVIAGIATGGGGEMPLETITFKYSAITMAANPVRAGAKREEGIAATWNVKTGRGGMEAKP